jgi:D-glycero-D-manno-heptose 1,7-bisphosphate phosphatase
MKRAAVFLDRDGTLIEDVGYLDAVDRIALYPWSVDAVRALNRAELPVVVVTNQSGIARGYFSEALVAETHREIDRRMSAGRARIDAYYYCPHHPDGATPEFRRSCACRKPAPGLVEQAARELGLDPARSYVVGDKWTDVRLGRAVGARALLVRTGTGRSEELRTPTDAAPDVVVDNLASAVSWVLDHLRCS